MASNTLGRSQELKNLGQDVVGGRLHSCVCVCACTRRDVECHSHRHRPPLNSPSPQLAKFKNKRATHKAVIATPEVAGPARPPAAAAEQVRPAGVCACTHALAAAHRTDIVCECLVQANGKAPVGAAAVPASTPQVRSTMHVLFPCKAVGTARTRDHLMAGAAS